MFICDTETGGILSAQLDGPKVRVIASDEHGRTAEVSVDAATVRGMLEELSAMADELDTEQLAAEVAAADAEPEPCGHEWRNAANHLTACALDAGHPESVHVDATGHTSQIAVSYRHLKGYRVRRVYTSREQAQEFIDVNAMICPLPGVQIFDIMRPAAGLLDEAGMAELNAAIRGDAQ